MSSSHDYQASALFYKEEMADPYEIIGEFFRSDSIAYHRKTIKRALVAAGSVQYSSYRPLDEHF